MAARVAPEPMPRACNPSRIGRSSHVASSETPAISSAITLTISIPTYAQCACERGPSPPASTASDRRVSRGRTTSTCASRVTTATAAATATPVFGGLIAKHADDDRSQRKLARVERTKDQAADAKTDLQRHTRRPELQRGLDEGDRQHHAQPDEHRGDNDGGSCIHGWSLRQQSGEHCDVAAVQIAGGSHQRDRAAAQHVAQFGQRSGPLVCLEL